MNETWWVNPEQLSDEQNRVLSLPLGDSHLILGPPGSGKTNLLLLRANYMALAGQANVALIVFTKALREFIVAGSGQYGFQSSKIVTSRKWAQDLLYQYSGERAAPPESFDEQRKYFIDKIEHLIQSKHLSALYDAILLDEAHDYLPAEISIFRRLAKSLFAVADPNQQIYKPAGSVTTLRDNVDQTHRLKLHYRNGLNICKVADAIAKDSSDYELLAPTSNYNEALRPSSVEPIRTASIEDAAARIVAKLQSQLKAYPDELLGVVSPRHEEVNKLWDIIRQSAIGNNSMLIGDSTTTFEPGKTVCISTLHASKGLEFRTLHIAGCEFLKRFPFARNMAFTGTTRAKTSLSAYHSDELPGFFEGALNTLNPIPDLPKMRDVFGGTQ